VIGHTGWRRCKGSLKLQISFSTRVADYRALLQKMTYKDEAFYKIFATLSLAEVALCVRVCANAYM